MSIVTARTFNQSPSKVKAMAKLEPVFVTDRGETTIVVLDIEEYRRLTGGQSLLDSLRHHDDRDGDIEFEPHVSRDLTRTVDL